MRSEPPDGERQGSGKVGRTYGAGHREGTTDAGAVAGGGGSGGAIRCAQDVRCAREPIEITGLGENEAAAIAGFEFYEDFEGKGEARKAA